MYGVVQVDAVHRVVQMNPVVRVMKTVRHVMCHVANVVRKVLGRVMHRVVQAHRMQRVVEVDRAVRVVQVHRVHRVM